jgi:hypothetical protein
MNAGAVDLCKACGAVIEYLGDCDCRNLFLRELNMEKPMLDVKRDEEERTAYELQRGGDAERELERFKMALGLLMMAGHLDKAKWEQALAMVKK